MKEGWRKATIAEVCDVVNGGTPKTGVAANWGGPHMWITPAEMGGRGDPYVGQTERQLTDVGLSAANLLPPKSVILSSRAPIGHLVINAVPMATNQGCKGLVPKASLDHKYLFYYLGSIVGLLNDLGTGATFKELSGGKLKEVPIPLPPVPQQQRIVAILDEAFAGLATATANAETNLENARELFDSYLVWICTRSCDDWPVRQLGEVCDLFQGLAINKGTKHLLVDKSSLPLLRIKDLRDGTQEQYVAEIGYPKNSAVSPEDLIYTRTGQVGLVFRGRQGVLHNNCFKVVPTADIVRGYLFWWLQNPHFRKSITALASRMAQPDITHTIFKAQPIHVPPLNYQRDAVEKLESLNADTQRLKAIFCQKVQRIADLKSSILQKAFGGGVSSPSQAVGEAAE